MEDRGTGQLQHPLPGSSLFIPLDALADTDALRVLNPLAAYSGAKYGFQSMPPGTSVLDKVNWCELDPALASPPRQVYRRAETQHTGSGSFNNGALSQPSPCAPAMEREGEAQ